MAKYLYLISQSANNDYDTYDSAVVVAESKEDAKKIHPSPYGSKKGEWWMSEDSYDFHDWVTLDKIEVKYIGVANQDLEVGTVVVSSFNAG